MSKLTPQQTRILNQRANRLLDRLDSRVTKLERHAKNDPLAYAATLGAVSGMGDEASINRDNRRLQKALSNPHFATLYFAAQRLSAQAKRRFQAGLPQRRLGKIVSSK